MRMAPRVDGHWGTDTSSAIALPGQEMVAEMLERVILLTHLQQEALLQKAKKEAGELYGSRAA